MKFLIGLSCLHDSPSDRLRLTLITKRAVVAGGNMKQFLNRFWKETRGQDRVEYSLAAGMVALAAVAAMPQLA